MDQLSGVVGGSLVQRVDLFGVQDLEDGLWQGPLDEGRCGDSEHEPGPEATGECLGQIAEKKADGVDPVREVLGADQVVGLCHHVQDGA